MQKLKTILPVILLIAALFVVVCAFGFSLRVYSSVYIFICGALLFFQLRKTVSEYQITLALLFFLFAEISSLAANSTDLGIVYHLINSFYILAYINLVHFLYKRLDIEKVLKKLKYFSVVLLAFFGYAMYHLNSVLFAGDGMTVWSVRFMLETLYNLVVLVLFVLSFINFLYYDSKKELLLFLSCIALVFSEIIQLTTIYAVRSKLLFIMSSILKVFGFFLMYYYITLKDDDNTVYDLLD